MGNMQTCCASGRFQEGKPPKIKKSKNKKIKNKPLKFSGKTNGVGSGKGDGGVQKVVTVAEDGAERPAPAAAEAQTASPAGDIPAAEPAPAPYQQHTTAAASDTDSDGSRNESMAAARERFFGQVFLK